jgi:hypothetical protein
MARSGTPYFIHILSLIRNDSLRTFHLWLLIGVIPPSSASSTTSRGILRRSTSLPLPNRMATNMSTSATLHDTKSNTNGISMSGGRNNSNKTIECDHKNGNDHSNSNSHSKSNGIGDSVTMSVTQPIDNHNNTINADAPMESSNINSAAITSKRPTTYRLRATTVLNKSEGKRTSSGSDRKPSASSSSSSAAIGGQTTKLPPINSQIRNLFDVLTFEKVIYLTPLNQ